MNKNEMLYTLWNKHTDSWTTKTIHTGIELANKTIMNLDDFALKWLDTKDGFRLGQVKIIVSFTGSRAANMAVCRIKEGDNFWVPYITPGLFARVSGDAKLYAVLKDNTNHFLNSPIAFTAGQTLTIYGTSFFVKT